MGMAKLNIWVSGTDDPCSIDNRTWFVTIYNCDGKVLEWCNKRYVVLPAPCGHLEIDVPPGCYLIRAVWSFVFAGGIFYVNHFTDAAIVCACCDEKACVTLFNPSLHRCGTILVRAIRDVVQQKGIKPDTAKNAETALAALLAEVPKPAKGFELDHLDEIERLVRAQPQEVKGGKKPEK